jgi:hypothetical protein
VLLGRQRQRQRTTAHQGAAEQHQRRRGGEAAEDDGLVPRLLRDPQGAGQADGHAHQHDAERRPPGVVAAAVPQESPERHGDAGEQHQQLRVADVAERDPARQGGQEGERQVVEAVAGLPGWASGERHRVGVRAVQQRRRDQRRAREHPEGGRDRGSSDERRVAAVP